MSEMTRKDEIPEIAKRIKQLRKAKGWTQPKLASEAKVTDGAVKMWETGKRFPRGANLKNLAKALGVPESSILDDTPPPIRQSEAKNSDRATRILSLQSTLLAMSDDHFDTVEAFVEGLEDATKSEKMTHTK